MVDLAQLRIEENKRNHEPFLDLGRCGLTQVPGEVADCPWLEFISLASEWYNWDGRDYRSRRTENTGPDNDRLVDIGPLAKLPHLRTLFAAHTEIDDLGALARLTGLELLDVSHTLVEDLTPLANLQRLSVLHVSKTRVHDLSPLARLRAIRELHVWGTLVENIGPLSALNALTKLEASRTKVADLSPLEHLLSLQELYIWSTRVHDLSPLSRLSSLQKLSVSNTRVADLEPLAGLDNLRKLDVPNTLVADLYPLRNLISRGRPVLWNPDPWASDGIYVEGCPLVNPPVEIVYQGNAAILDFFRARESDDVDYLYEAKMLLVGEGGAGKTSLLRRLYQPDRDLPTEKETTKGIEIHRHEFTLENGRTFRLNVWDFGGQEIYHATHQFFLTRRSLYVLLDDTRKDHKSVSDAGFKDWLELIDLLGDHSPVLIFQNMKGDRSKTIDFSGIQSAYPNVVDKFSGNLEIPGSVNDMCGHIERYASHLSHIGEQLPARWIRVRADIEERATTEPYISQDEYFNIYGRHMVFDRVSALRLSQYLHDIGVFLHFQGHPLLAHTVILQNSWATEAVFRILDAETVKGRNGRFTKADCERLWQGSAYAAMHSELLALMERFELCYLLADRRPETWLAPQLLSPAKPAGVANWGKSDDLVLRYRYTFMPKGMISRLTVRMNRFVNNPMMAWTTGVLFERDGTQVLVEMLPSGKEIELRARGPEGKALLSVIASDLDALNESYEGLRDKVDKHIPCKCRVCRDADEPEFFAQKRLLKRKANSYPQVQCEASYDFVDVVELLDGIRVNSLPTWADKGRSGGTQRCLTMFIASSVELKSDREAFELHFLRENERLRKDGIRLAIVHSETFLDSVSETRKQDDYDAAVRSCDIFVCLFFTKAGNYTVQEFETAYLQYQTSRKPKIFTFFKNGTVNINRVSVDELQSLKAMQARLSDLGHYWKEYDTVDALNVQFRSQLDKLLASEI